MVWRVHYVSVNAELTKLKPCQNLGPRLRRFCRTRIDMTNIVCVFQAMRAMNEPFESREDAKAEMARMDKDGSMTIDFPEFVNFITPRLLESGSARYDVEEQYLKFCDLCLTHHEILTDGKCPLDEGGNKSECNKGDPDIE